MREFGLQSLRFTKFNEKFNFFGSGYHAKVVFWEVMKKKYDVLGFVDDKGKKKNYNQFKKNNYLTLDLIKSLNLIKKKKFIWYNWNRI